MNWNALSDYFVVVVLVACLVIGYIIKHASFLKWVPNNDIPVILAVVGAGLNLIVSGPSVESGVYGALMGLASTGLHQAFCGFVEGKKSSTDSPSEEKTDDAAPTD